MPRIRWTDDEEASGEIAEIYTAWKGAHPGRDRMPDILKCLSQRPDLLRSVIDIADSVHFRDGHLPYRTKELIATFVSGLNRCPY